MPPKPSLDALLAKSAKAKHVRSATTASQSTGSVLRYGQSVSTVKANLPAQLPLRMLPSTQNSSSMSAPPSAPLPTQGPPPSKPSPSKPAPKSRSSQFVGDFESRKDRIVELFFQQYTAEGLGEPCPCGMAGARRTTTCRDCWQYHATCSHCFVNAHKKQPTHWAEVWGSERGYFVRHDISALEGNPAIHLGHGGDVCLYSNKSTPKPFIVIDLNGVHNTKLVFCGCLGALKEEEQLLAARLFPATFRNPHMAFTFNLLHNFHIHHLETAEPAYDFIAALRHLTDGFFFDQASDPYDQFREVFKLYRVLVAEVRAGVFHGVNKLFPNRPPDDVGVYCPACLEVDINWTEDEAKRVAKLEPKFRHLLQVLVTADGNFHANHYAKTHDKSQDSLLGGRACFPDDGPYRAHMEQVNKKESKTNAEKTTCSFLKAVNRQDKSKFAGMDVSGIVNIQCPHVIILSSVDLYKGEKFAHTDYAIYHALQRLGFPKLSQELLELIDFLFSYDISCAYAVKLIQRCIDYGLSEILPIVRRFRPLIPLLHIQNHKDNCMYEFSSAYTESAGHFYGEQAEQGWPYSNQFAGQGRQMSHANRHLLYIDIFNHWNHKKRIGMASQLYNDLQRSDKLRQEKLDVFLGLCELYKDMLVEWRDEPRDKRHKVGKEVNCVYRHSPSELPSKQKIYKALTKELKADTTLDKSKAKTIPLMLNHSLTIRRLQQKIKSYQAAFARYGEARFQTSINTFRGQLERSLTRFRELQATLVPEIEAYAAGLDDDEDEMLEDETLYTPSDIPGDERIRMQLTRLAELERKLLEGAAYDTLAKLRTSVRLLSSLSTDGKAHVWGQAGHTRQQGQIINATIERDLNIDFFNTIRQALIRLGLPEDDKSLRRMSIKSTFRKSTDSKRALGDTGRTDGTAWTAGGINSDKQRQQFRPLINPQSSMPESIVGVQSSQTLKRASLFTMITFFKQWLTPPLGKNNPSATSRDGKKAKLQPPSTSESATQPGGEASTSGPPVGETRAPSSLATSAQGINDDDDDDDYGWIWNVKSPNKKISDAEVERYLREGDRVQWFRAEAEMMRWQEEWERKLVEFVRCIRSFEKTADAWSHVSSEDGISEGMASYGKKTANRFRELANRARHVFCEQAHHDASELGTKGVPSIVDYIVSLREKLDLVVGRAMGRNLPDALGGGSNQP